MPNDLLLTEPRSIAVRPYGEEPLAANEVRAEAIVSGISHGTELALYRGVSPFDGKRFDTDLRVFVDDAARAAYPMRLGYEWVGTVTETGADVQAPRAGDLVHLSLPHRETHTFAVDDERKPLTPLPGDLDPERAALLSSATIALQAIHDARVKVGDTVAVFGLGVFGLLAVQLARLSGARWIAAVDPIAGRRELARRLGADAVLDPAAADAGCEIKVGVGRGGVDAAIEFSGRYSALHAALRSARLAGTVVAAGFYTGGAGDDLRLGEEWHHNRLSLVSSMSGWGAPHREAGWDRPRLRATVLELIASGRLEVDALVTQRIPFAQAAGAYDLIDREPETALKVVLEYRARG
jgi:2-desacetyl-2-hydroxyethyl bacteriochlorophyllide A dehydrogenase